MLEAKDPLPASQLGEHVGFWMGLVNDGSIRQIEAEPKILTPLAAVSGGDSRDRYCEEIGRVADMGTVWAINGAHAWCLANGIIPRAQVILDPLPAILRYIPPEPNAETIYYVASIAHPRVWERLRGRDVRLFHSAGGANVPFGPGVAFAIGGGPTTATRIPYLANVLGYRNINLYGVDSSFAGAIDRDGWYHGSIRVRCDGREFLTQHDLLLQAKYLRDMLASPQGDMRVGVQTVRDTLVAAMLSGDGTYEIIPDATVEAA